MTSRQRSETRPGTDEVRTVELYTPEELRQRREQGRKRRRRPRARRPGKGPPRPPRERPPRRPARTGGPGLAARISVLVGGIAAVAIFALALADGGFEPVVWAQATILVWWTALAASLAGAWRGSSVPVAAAVAALCLLGLAVLSAASLWWATDTGAAYEDAIRAAGYLGVFVLAAVAARAGLARALLGGIAIGIFAVGLLALLTRLQPGLVGGADEARGLEISGGRLGYPIGYWNGLGAMMAIGIPLLIWLAASAGSRLRRTLAACAVPVCVLTLFFSGSRGGALATAGAIVVLIAAGPRRVTLTAVAASTMFAGLLLSMWGSRSSALLNGAQGETAAQRGDELLVIAIVATALLGLFMWLADRRIGRLHLPVIGAGRAAVGLAIVFALLAALAMDPSSGLRSFDEGPKATRVEAENTRFTGTGVGGSGRAQFWEAAADAIAEEPLRGIGAGGFEAWWAQNGTLDFSVAHAHSFYLESAAELGIGAGLLAVAFFAVPVAAGVRRRLAPTAWAESEAARGTIGAALAALAAGALAAVVEWTWDIPAAFAPAVAAAACLCVPAARRRAPSRVRPLGAFALVALAGAASIAAAGALYLEQLALDRSHEAVRAGNLGTAVDEAKSAASTLDLAADPHTQLALIERRRGNSARAVAALADARDRATEDWALPFIEAGVEFQAGRTGRAVWALNQAQALLPRGEPGLFAVPSTRNPGPYAERLRKAFEAEDDASG